MAQRCCLPLEWPPLLHRSGQAPAVSGARKFRAPRVTIIFGMAHASIVWLPDGGLSVLAHCEYPNGLALSPDERIMYVANTRSSQYIQATKLDAAGNMVGRSIFADLNEGSEPGTPDGSKVDSVGRVYCTGPGGIWVIAPDGKRLGIIEWPEQAVNFAFGGPDLRTLLCCAHTSVYMLRVEVPGNPHPWYKSRGQ